MSEKSDVAEEKCSSKVTDCTAEWQEHNLESSEAANVKLNEPAVSSYIQEWDIYFIQHKDEDQFLNSLKSKAFKESLRSCVFRSVCWRVSYAILSVLNFFRCLLIPVKSLILIRLDLFSFECNLFNFVFDFCSGAFEFFVQNKVTNINSAFRFFLVAFQPM